MVLDSEGVPGDATSSSALRVLVQRNFGPYFLGNFVTSVGTWIQNIAMALLIFRLTGSTFLVAMVSFAQFIGLIVLAPWTGSAADRFDRRRTIVLTQVSATLIGAMLAVATYLDRTTPVWLIGAALFFSVTKAFALPAQQALVPQLVARRDLQAAVALNAITYNLARAVGPVVGAGIILTLGFTWAFSINALSYLALAAAVLIVKAPQNARSDRKTPTKLIETIRMVRNDPKIGPLLIGIAAVAVAIDPVSNLTPAFTVEIYGRPEAFTGILIGVFGLGAAIAAALVVAKLRTSFRGVALAMAGVGITICTFGMSTDAEVGLVALFLAGIAYIISISLATTMVQVHVAEDHRGRVMALWGVAFLGVRPAASLLDGIVATWVDVRAAAILMAVPVMVGAVYVARRAKGAQPDPARGSGEVAAEGGGGGL